jgi:hypothetical protein
VEVQSNECPIGYFVDNNQDNFTVL